METEWKFIQFSDTISDIPTFKIFYNNILIKSKGHMSKCIYKYIRIYENIIDKFG